MKAPYLPQQISWQAIRATSLSKILVLLALTGLKILANYPQGIPDQKVLQKQLATSQGHGMHAPQVSLPITAEARKALITKGEVAVSIYTVLREI